MLPDFVFFIFETLRHELFTEVNDRQSNILLDLLNDVKAIKLDNDIWVNLFDLLGIRRGQIEDGRPGDNAQVFEFDDRLFNVASSDRTCFKFRRVKQRRNTIEIQNSVCEGIRGDKIIGL